MMPLQLRHTPNLNFAMSQPLSFMYADRVSGRAALYSSHKSSAHGQIFWPGVYTIERCRQKLYWWQDKGLNVLLMWV